MVSDCMLPAALAAGEAAAIPTVSLVHFLYGLARHVMLQAGGSWTTDLHALAQTRSALGLAPLDSGLAAWERPDLVLVTAPDWLDIDADRCRPPEPRGGRGSGNPHSLRHRNQHFAVSLGGSAPQID